VDSLLEWYNAEVMGPWSPLDLLKMVPLGGYSGADCMLRSGLLLPAEPSIVILGGARARFVLRALAERVLGVRFAVEGVAGATETFEV
jgi:hypothetical protein